MKERVLKGVELLISLLGIGLCLAMSKRFPSHVAFVWCLIFTYCLFDALGYLRRFWQCRK